MQKWWQNPSIVKKIREVSSYEIQRSVLLVGVEKAYLMKRVYFSYERQELVMWDGMA